MCVTINRYQNIINNLGKDVYPSFQQLLDNAEIQNAGLLMHKADCIVARIRKYFEFLVTFDNEIAFPAVLSIFNDNNSGNKLASAVKDMINRSSLIEEQLRNSIDEIMIVLNNNDLNISGEDSTGAKALHNLANFFYTRFLPVRQLWKQRLSRLESSDNIQCDNRSVGKCKCSHDANDKMLHTKLNIHEA